MRLQASEPPAHPVKRTGSSLQMPFNISEAHSQYRLNLECKILAVYIRSDINFTGSFRKFAFSKRNWKYL